AAAVSASEPPRSAIPWLSESLKSAPTLPEAAPEITPPGDPDAVIETSTLATPSRDGTGLLTEAQTGLPAGLWGQSSALRVRNLIADHPGTGVPGTQALFTALLLAEVTPPPGASASNAVLLARIDKLLAFGHLEQAEALISAAGITDPELFRRAFDIGLLTDRSEPVCETLSRSPGLSPTLPARIFCLARNGDWNAAALTLTTGTETGDVSEIEAEILARFLDPQLFEDAPAPPEPEPLTTLDFVIRDAVALPRPTGPLPLAFYHLDLPDHQPIRARIEAGERLIRTGAISPSVLFAAYRAGKPAASGGVWDHAAAIQALDAALAGEELLALERDLIAADDLFSRIGLRATLARAVAPELALLPAEALSPRLRARVAPLLLLAEEYRAANAVLADTNDPVDQVFRALTEPGTAFPDSAALNPLKRAAARGLTRPDAPDATTAFTAARMEQGFLGEGILNALALLAAGPEVDPGDFEAALFLLRRAGLSDWARRIATETLLLLPEA
ncbi:MAG: hypothetical protein AAFY59_04760, partial [Pseudomonadota bacterium]